MVALRTVTGDQAARKQNAVARIGYAQMTS
jgi:hypothetical protein